MYYALFAYNAWHDGTTLTVPVWSLVALCLVAVAPVDNGLSIVSGGRVAPPYAATLRGWVCLYLASLCRCNPGDAGAIFAVGLRHGVTETALIVVISTAVAACVILLGAVSGTGDGAAVPFQRRVTGTPWRPGRTPDVSTLRVPFLPALLIGELVAGVIR